MVGLGNLCQNSRNDPLGRSLGDTVCSHVVGVATMRVLVCGGRDYSDLLTMTRELLKLDPLSIIVHGAARGADSVARLVAEHLGMQTEAHPADWNRHGKSAGPIRNQAMLDTGIDLVLAFPGGRGTADMVGRAKRAGVCVREVQP
jgi:hypothetical protein